MLRYMKGSTIRPWVFQRKFERQIHRICWIVLLLPVVALSAGPVIEKGDNNLLANEVLSRPYTLFDQLLYSLEKEADQQADKLKPRKADFVPSAVGASSVGVEYDEELFRVMVTYSISVHAMNDPWEEVCEDRLRTIAHFLRMLGPGSKAPQSTSNTWKVRAFSTMYLGPMASVGALKEEERNLQSFIDAIVLGIGFIVLPEGEKEPKYHRTCWLYVEDESIHFKEHRY